MYAVCEFNKLVVLYFAADVFDLLNCHLLFLTYYYFILVDVSTGAQAGISTLKNPLQFKSIYTLEFCV